MSKSLKVLLIEDNLIEIMKMNRTVSFLEAKHEITEAKNAEEALAILETKENLPDIILLDLNMPKINGIEFLSILKKVLRLFFVYKNNFLIYIIKCQFKFFTKIN